MDESRNLADGAGYDYQTTIDEALRLYLGKALNPADETALPQVHREQMRRAAHN